MRSITERLGKSFVRFAAALLGLLLGAGARRMATQTLFALSFLATIGLLAAPVLAQTVQVTPQAGPSLSITKVDINPDPSGDHFDPHVSGDLAVYTSGTTVHYYRFSTGVDTAIPIGNSHQDLLSDTDGTRIVFSRVLSDRTAICLFDTKDGTLTEIDPTPGPSRFSAVVAGDSVAYIDSNLEVGGELVVHDLPTGTATRLTKDSAYDISPNISPDGNTLVCQHCETSYTVCDIWQAVKLNGTWTVNVASSDPANEELPDTNGGQIVYDSDRPSGAGDIFFRPVGGGTETELLIPGIQINPNIAGNFIAFESRSFLSNGSVGLGDIYLYDISQNLLYNITNTPDQNDELDDITVLSSGEVIVVYDSDEYGSTHRQVHALRFTPPATASDFNLALTSPMTIVAGGSGSTTVTVNPLSGFSSMVDLASSGQPGGVAATLSPSQVTPSGGNPATSVLNVSLPLSIVPSNFTLTITGTSGLLSHSTAANVTVTVTAASTGDLIGNLLSAGFIDNAGIANALTSKLSAAQSAISAGNIATAINTLTALKNQILAQTGKHIATSCTIGGVDVQSLIDSLKVSMLPNPVTGYVVDSAGVGVPGAILSIVDAGGNKVATATSDITGFYFLATTGALTPGAAYKLGVAAFPGGFASSTPLNQAFTWQGTAIAFTNFLLN
jgi:hypothetical protein